MLEVTSAWYSLFMVTDGHSWPTMVILHLEHTNLGDRSETNVAGLGCLIDWLIDGLIDCV